MDAYISLRDAEFKIYGEIVQLRSIANSLQLAETASLSDLEAMVIGHRFRVAVVGEFNRGKSTAINALLGAEVLPASIEACSAALNRVTYGQQVTARVVLRGEGPPELRSELVPLDELVAYVTKLSPEAARMSSSVEEAVITYPSRFCRNNVDLIDTPGLNDEPTMTAVTMRALGRIHAAILVIRAAFSFSHSEQLLLEKLLNQDVTNILFLVTAIDELDQADQPRIIRETRNRIFKALRQYADDIYEEGTEEYEEFLARFGQLQIYGVAALMALEAKQSQSVDREQASGYPVFETALEALLASREGVVAVAQIARKLLKVCEQIERAIQERNTLSDGQQVQHILTESGIEQVFEQTINEAQRYATELRRDADDARFRIHQIINQHSNQLESIAMQLLSNLPISGGDVVAIAGRIWRDQANITQVPQHYQRWAVDLAKSIDKRGPDQIESFAEKLHAALAVMWPDIVATIVRQIFVETKNLRESTEVRRIAFLGPIEELIKQLDPQIAASCKELLAISPFDRAATATTRSVIVQQIVYAPPSLQIQPKMVALRAVIGMAPTISTISDLTDFLHSFQVLCQRAILGSLEANKAQRMAHFAQLLDHTEEIFDSITSIPITTAQQISTLKQMLDRYRLRNEQQNDSQHQATKQQLAQVNSIKTVTANLLNALEQTAL